MPENLFSKLDENSKSLRVKAQEFACAIKDLLGEQYGSVKSLCDELEKMNTVPIADIGNLLKSICDKIMSLKHDISKDISNENSNKRADSETTEEIINRVRDFMPIANEFMVAAIDFKIIIEEELKRQKKESNKLPKYENSNFQKFTKCCGRAIVAIGLLVFAIPGLIMACCFLLCSPIESIFRKSEPSKKNENNQPVSCLFNMGAGIFSNMGLAYLYANRGDDMLHFAGQESKKKGFFFQ